ncbi:MAG TPA: 1,4-beta-xylanase, partial [Terrimesophilobacter sp.]|nr:1,4-beta-xylanase [Terrimesophilobacter sp.]
MTDSADSPLRNVEVVVAQTRHDFTFGNIGFDFLELSNGEPNGVGTEQLAELYTDLFNTATLPFYWGRFEPERGTPDTVRLRQAAVWFRERGVALKGHPLVWHSVQP